MGGHEVPYVAEPVDEYCVYQFKESDGTKLNLGEDNAVVSSSPSVQNLHKRGPEAHYRVEPADEHAVQRVKEFDGKMLEFLTKEELDLGDEDEKKTLEELNTKFKPLAELTKDVLSDKAEMVIVSDRIVDSPC